MGITVPVLPSLHTVIILSILSILHMSSFVPFLLIKWSQEKKKPSM